MYVYLRFEVCDPKYYFSFNLIFSMTFDPKKHQMFGENKLFMVLIGIFMW